MKFNTSPPSFKTIDEIFFEIVEKLCERFIGLSPFEVLNTPIGEVFDLYVDVIIHDMKEKQGSNQDQWVTSANATWH